MTVLVFGCAGAETLPTKENCRAAIAHARVLANQLAVGSMSRRFADSDLVQAGAEGGNGEFDDCLEYAAKAEDEVRHPHHGLPAPHKPQQEGRGK
ncbi:MAG: hypothetical protein WDN04_16075 [Rhodospirillales bacterium]